MARAMLEVRVELRVRGDRAVLTTDDEQDLAPEGLPLGADLAAALHEWAKVAAVLRKASIGETAAVAEPGEDTVGVVARRGHQLAGRVASELREPVYYRDPITDVSTVVVPHPAPQQTRRAKHASPHGTRLFRRTPGEPTPWATGLTVSTFFAAIVAISILALTSTVARETGPWLAAGAALVFTAGMVPSLWLGRHVPVLRWICFGAGAGLVAGFIGLPFVLF